MFKVGDTVIHIRDVCKVTSIVKDYRDGEDYYRLVPVDNEGLVIHSPASNARGMIRKMISKSAAKDLIKSIPTIEPLETDGRALAAEYKTLIDKCDHQGLVQIIKTAYVRNESKAKDHKKPNENDKTYFRLAENILYSELATVLDVSVDQAKELVVNQVSTLDEQEATVAP